MMRTILSFFAYLLLACAPSCDCIYQEKNHVIVGYFTDWSHFRTGAGSYDVKKLDICNAPCSHIAYSFATYDAQSNGLLIKDMDTDIISKLTSCTNKGKVILLAVGGWTYSKSGVWDPLFESEERIDAFIENAYKFIEKYQLHGVDYDLEYPGDYQGTNKTTDYDGKAMFSYLVKNTKKKFQEGNYLVTVAVSADPEKIDEYYEVDVLNEHADWLGIMAYDYYSYTGKKTGLCAPLTNQKGETRKWNVKDSVETWLQKGLSPKKTVMGLPLYGKAYKLNEETLHGIGDPAAGEPELGIYTGEKGVLSFQEICLHIKQDGWTEVYEKEVGAYAYKSYDWVGYDNIQSVIEKAKFILEKQLLGGMFWELGFDDFNNQCGCGNYSMMTAFQNTLKNIPVSL